MSESNRPGDIPSDLPPEYAEAYRRGYERARNEPDSLDDATQAIAFEDLRQPPAGARPTGGSHAAGRSDAFEPAEERTQVTGPLFADEAPAAPYEEAEPTQTLDRSSLLGQMLSVESDAPARPVDPEPTAEDWGAGEDDYESRRKPTWLVPLLLCIAGVVLVGAAFGIGKWVSSTFVGADTSSNSSSASGGTSSGSGSGGPLTGQKYSGPVKPVAIQSATASCQAPNAVDASGNSVNYSPRNMLDGDPTTAWRCDGDGVGQKLTFQIPAGTKIGEVGLIPGYAKTDPASGADRYAENNRITKVRWIFDGNKTVEQTLDGSAGNRGMQTMRVPRVESGKVVLEILSSTPGPRHTVAISEVRIASGR